jgi:hypothetical protein
LKGLSCCRKDRTKQLPNGSITVPGGIRQITSIATVALNQLVVYYVSISRADNCSWMSKTPIDVDACIRPLLPCESWYVHFYRRYGPTPHDSQTNLFDLYSVGPLCQNRKREAIHLQKLDLKYRNAQTRCRQHSSVLKKGSLSVAMRSPASILRCGLDSYHLEGSVQYHIHPWYSEMQNVPYRSGTTKRLHVTHVSIARATSIA